MTSIHRAVRWAVAPILGLAIHGPTGPSAAAQVTTFGVSVRADYLRSRDALVSPRAYQGFGLSQNGFVIGVRTAGSIHELTGWIGTVDIGSGDRFDYTVAGRSARTPSSEAELGEGAYTYLRPISGGRLWLGLAASLQTTHTRYELAAGVAEGFLYVAAVEAVGRREFALQGDRILLVSLRLPLLGWSARPRYSTVDEDRLTASSDFLHRMNQGRLRALHQLRSASARIGLIEPLGDVFAVRGGVILGYSRDPDPEPYSALRAAFDLALTVTWPGADR